jgi:hypothetical protein
MYTTLGAALAVMLPVGLMLLYAHAPNATDESRAFIKLVIYDLGIYAVIFGGVVGFVLGGKDEDRVHKHEHTITNLFAVLATGTIIAPWFIL